MRKIEPTVRFKKDYKRLKKSIMIISFEDKREMYGNATLRPF